MKPIVYGAEWCGFCHRLMDWLKANNVEFEYKNVDEPGMREDMNARTDGNQTIPVLFVGEQFWVHPGSDVLQSLFIDKKPTEGTRDYTLGEDTGTTTEPEDSAFGSSEHDGASVGEEVAPSETEDSTSVESDEIWDVLMIGAGPASLASAVYTAREDLKTVVVEKAIVGGLAAITDMVDNYPGFPDGIEGMKLADNLEAQVKRFGATITLDEVKSISKDGDIFTVELVGGVQRARSILIGTGSEWKKLGIPGEQEFYGKGVHNCATCDGAFYRDKKLVVVGGGNSAAQEALFLTKFASHIDILVRGDKWKASDVLVHEVEKNEKLTVHFNTTTEEILGEGNSVNGVRVKTSDNEQTLETDGVFVFIGLKPVTYYLEGSGVELDEWGFVKTSDKLETSVPGIFCAGDVRSGATMQIASAVGEGAAAALSIRNYLEAH